MGVELDIAGNFGRGQQVMIDRRKAKQLERQRDYDLAADADLFSARRSAVDRFRSSQGLEPMEFAPLETNPDPWYQRLGQWWKQRRAGRVMPSRMMPEQTQTMDDEAAAMGFGGPAETFPLDNGGGDIAVTPYKDGGRVRAIPRYQDGGGVGEPEMARRRRAAEFRRQGTETRTSQTRHSSGPAGPRGTPGTAGRAIPRESFATRATNALRGRGASAAGRARALKGGAIAAGAAVLPQLDEDYDINVDKRFGWGDSAAQPGEGEGSLGGFARYFGRRALGYASDLADTMTFGAAGNLYRDNQAIPTEAQAQEGHKDASKPSQPPEAPPTPDEAIAQAAIADGTRMAEEATAGSKPPGAVDFSKVDFDPGEMPNMTVKDWVEYRQGAIQDALMRGASQREAYEQGMQSVTTMQQQGFVDYAQQSLMHMQSGNMRAAANALRAAYQYFPNGSDVKIGVQQGQDGRPVLIGVGTNEETGEPVGQPMILNDERLTAMIENFSKPGALNTWAKDIRAEELDRRKFFEQEKPAAESTARYQDRLGRAALRNAEANVIDAERQARGTGARTQANLDHANEVFREASFELATDEDPGTADRIAALMSRIYARKPNLQDNEVVDFVKEAARRGDLERVMAAAGIEPAE